jgi:DNA-binding transcriptional regulator GbsR (MarR family)
VNDLAVLNVLGIIEIKSTDERKTKVNVAQHRSTPTELFDTLLALGKILGLSRSVATVFAVLYSHEESLSIEDLVEQTGLSKSAVSLALRDLAQLGAVQERGIVGERSRRYAGQAHLGEVVTEIVLSRIKHPLSELRDKVNQNASAGARLHQVRNLLDTFETTLARMTHRNQG